MRARIDPLAALVCVLSCAALGALLVVPLAFAGSSGVDKGGAGKGFVTGCVFDFSGDAGTVSMTAGAYRNRANTITVDVASAVSLAAAFQAFSWATGGGIDTGAEAGSTWYAVHAVEHTDGTDAILLSTSASAPTAQTGQASRRLLGWVRNDGSSNLIQSYQVGDGTTRSTIYREEDAAVVQAPFTVLNNGGATAFTYVDCAGVMPPTQTETAIFSLLYTPSANNFFIYHGVDTNNLESGGVSGYDGENGVRANAGPYLRVDGDEDVAYRVSTGTGAYFQVFGFVSVFDGSE